MAELLSDDLLMDDRRRVVNAGVRHGRDAEIASQRAIADVGVTDVTPTVLAIRGECLALCCYSIADGWSGSEALSVSEINAENQIVARVVFDPEDIDLAFGELEARYVGGEGAGHSHTWSAIARAYAAFNRRELPGMARDSVYVDHRPVIAVEAVDLAAALRSAWDLTPNIRICIEAVHRLSDLGAVVTQTLRGSSEDGFEAAWRFIDIFTVDGERLSRCEIFDEAELDAALARFQELQAQTRRLQNAATQVAERFPLHFNSRQWDSLAEMLAADISVDDRRRGINAGIRRGRDATIEDLRASVDAGFTNIRVTVIATRGERLVVTGFQISETDRGPEAFGVDVLHVAEVNADGQIAEVVVFDLDDIDAAFEELDGRYLSGEAAAHAHTWSVIAGVPARFNRRELFPMTPDPAYVDHRPLVSVEGADLAESVRAVWELTSEARVYIEAVHQLSEIGAVITEVLKMTSQEGLDAEVRMIMMFTVEGDLISGVEVFDEADLDAALARLEELQPRAQGLGNAASQVAEKFWSYFAAREWAAMAELVAPDILSDDRRRIVNGGIRRGRANHLADMKNIAEVLPDTDITSMVIATRGERLVLTRIYGSDRGPGAGEVTAELLSVVEIDSDERIVAHIGFDIDDIDAAFEELETRYLAGEAAAHAQTWSVIAEGFARFNRRELPATTKDHVYIDHRPLVSIEGVDLAVSFRAYWDLTSEAMAYVEAVHRLSELGAAFTQVLKGTWQEGSDAELRVIDVVTVEGHLISRAEAFDEVDLDIALARFDELHR
jgi:hypothetical protein